MKLRVLFITLISLCFSVSAFAADNIKDMFTQGYGSGEIRTLDFTRDFAGSTNTRSDMAIGGMLYYHTAPLHGLSFGVAFATANDINSNDDDNVYGILQKDSQGNHESFSRMQEYYVQGNWYNTVIKYGAQEIRTPFMEVHDLRMIPRTYKGASVVNNSIDNLTLSAYYITDSMGWSDDEFISLSQAVANEPGGASTIRDEKAMTILGASYDVPVDAVKTNVQAWYYTLEDIYNESYLKASASKKFGDVTVHVKPSVLYQTSQGENLNGDFNAYQYGVNAGVGMYGFDLTGFYAKTGNGDLLQPWGDDKVIIQQVLASGRADEKATAAKLSYDFGALGVKGLSAYAFYADYNVPSDSTARDVAETDFSVQYAFHGALDGLGLRARYAMINYDGGEDYKDIRYYATYKFAFGSK